MSRGEVAFAKNVDWSVNNKPELHSDSLDKAVAGLLSKMTLEQKVAQMIQPEIGYLSVEQMRRYGFGSYLNGGNTAPYGLKRADQKTWLKYADEMYEASVDGSIDGSKIPTVWGTDAMHGHSNVFGATLFPHNIGLGATRNPALIAEIGRATAKEVAATGIEWVFAPTVAVVRDDRWGRTYESYSEDPEIVARYAGRMVAGIQGTYNQDYLEGYHRLATAKHFIGDGGTENGIDRGNTVIDERTLRDIHGAGYFSALQAGVQSVMASFNSWNGERVHGHKYLLTDVLKGQMGFEGFVVSDWNAHKFVDGCDLQQCAAAINAGVDVLMVPEHFEAFFHNTVRQVQEGVIPLSRIDDAVGRFLKAKMRWGLFSRPKPSMRVESKHPEWFNAKAHRELAEKAVRQSLVLLKNNGHVLPISPKSRILVAGKGADNIAMQAGGWSVSWQGSENTNADFPHATSIYQGLRQQVVAANGAISLSVDGSYDIKPDVAIVVIGEQPYAEWFGDIKTLDFGQIDNESLAILKRLKAEHIPTVTVFLSGRPLWVNKELNASDAFVAAWLPGSEGQGVADVILADANGSVQHDFSGKLSFSWPRYDNQFTVNRNDKQYEPLFPYGYGLTYKDSITQGAVSEIVSKQTEQVDTDNIPLFVRNLSPDVKWGMLDGSAPLALVDGPSGISPDGYSLSMQSVNLAYQEDARKFVWHSSDKSASAILHFVTPKSAKGVLASRFLELKMRPDVKKDNTFRLQALCSGDICSNSVNSSTLATRLKKGVWNDVSIEIGCHKINSVSKTGLDALRIVTKGLASLAVADVALVKSPKEGSQLFSCP
ncbi:glycoside hydrolase family 3 protein [Pseudoalteromonas sp. JBTF-M23]|uniref:Glycoside hydrolase family 3 protein n=2 Tax=Pseudoalteromonas caenipelagi TaxID=2726988 RepID=A0A849VC11_9GAMM|nr:glycoside hydrolase family 3 protein [Pseudoalteromonas caenipelagi]NOU50575.1 glycoside hydrolase family 3 protein [Pseudoalteromonas caenipelagi]